MNIEGFLRFADFFFDGLFADWAVGDEISKSLSAVQNTRDRISEMLSKLENMESATRQEIEKLMAEREELVVNAQL